MRVYIIYNKNSGVKRCRRRCGTHIAPLKKAKEIINNSLAWCEEINRLCNLQRLEIEETDEHLAFAEFWYNLLNQKTASGYLVEYKARKIAQKLSDEKLTNTEALNQLRNLKSIDANNPVLVNIIEGVEIASEAEEILDLMNNDQFEEAVKKAKRSHHQKIRFMVAEICIDMLLRGAQTNKLPLELVLQLGRWTYELCPNEQSFWPIFRDLRLIY